MDVIKYFMAILTVQLFFSFGFTLLAYSMAPYHLNPDVASQFQANTKNLSDISNRLEGATTSERNLPSFVDVGAMIFYSGNILLDLILNFVFALPSLVTLLVSMFLFFFNLPGEIAVVVKTFIYAIVSIIYILNLLVFITSFRAGRGIV